MKFDIKQHLQNHAYLYNEFDTHNNTDLHFKFSVLDLYFYANNYNNIEQKLKEISNDLLKQTKYTIKQKNGFYIDKNGNKKQKYANRNIKIDLKSALTTLAIHIKGSKNEYTQPHIHFLIKQNARLGLNYSLLKYHISKTLEKYNLKAHFDEINDYKYTKLAKSVSKFFWQLKKLNDKEFEKYVAKNSSILKKYLDLLYNYTKSSNRLDYFFKTMQILRKRLNKLNINFKYNNHNIRYSYDINFLLENKENSEIIRILQQKKYSQKNIENYINNAILRDAVRYSINKKSSYIVNEIKHNTNLLDNFKANKTLTNNYLKLLKKELQTTKTKTQLKEQGKLEYINAFKNALKIAKNEKELREILKEKYDFKFKKRKGKVVGFEFNNTYLSIKELNFKDISEIRQILMSNYEQHTKNRSETLKIDYKTEKNQKNLEKRRIYYESRNYQRIAELIRTTKENAERESRNKRIVISIARRELEIKSELAELTERELANKREIATNAERELTNKRAITRVIIKNKHRIIRFFEFKLKNELEKQLFEFAVRVKKFKERLANANELIRASISELRNRIRKKRDVLSNNDYNYFDYFSKREEENLQKLESLETHEHEKVEKLNFNFKTRKIKNKKFKL